MLKFLRNNSLSVVIFCLFAIFIVLMSITGWVSENNNRQEHNQPAQDYGSYIVSGDFTEAVFENWESEFLQMWALVILTIYLRQKGSEDSKPLRGKTPQDTSSRYSLIRATTWRQRGKAAKHLLYSHSLGLALLLLFISSFVAHAIGGVEAFNEEARSHNQETVTLVQYVGSSQFWFESFQNWQSEFLAVGVLMVLSIKLRERGSPESKPVGKSYDRATSK